VYAADKAFHWTACTLTAEYSELLAKVAASVTYSASARWPSRKCPDHSDWEYGVSTVVYILGN